MTPRWIPAGDLVDLRMVPMQMKRMRLQRVSAEDAAWLVPTLTRIRLPFGTRVERAEDGLRAWR